MHVAGVNRDARTFEHVDPADGRRRPRRADLRAVGQGHGAGARRADAASSSTTRAPRAVVERVKDARAPRLPLRGRRRLVRPADPPRDRRLRAAVPARVVARDRREARGRAASRPRPRSRSGSTASATCAPPRATARCNALDRALRDAIGETYPHLRDIELVNFKVRILDETQGHRRGHARAAGRERRPRHLGRDRRLREHDRGELGGARRLARGRHAARPRRARREAAARR